MKKSKSKENAPEENTVKKNGQDDFLIVGIGASAGGIQALKEFFENVPAESGMAYVVILHLSPDHDSQLAEVLQAVAQIPVTQIVEKVRVEPNRVYVVPPNQHLQMYDGHILASPNTSVEERRAPVDIFFRTLAESHRARAIAVILSGTGANGSMGLKRIKERGGVAFVQNPREAAFSEMPRNSIATELVDAVLNACEIPAKIIAYKESLGKVEIAENPVALPEDDQAALREIFTHLRVCTRHDFSDYKRATVLRRIERRININELENLPAYAAYLRDSANEATALLKDLLISVTNFFRDKEAFQFLEQEILPRLMQDKSASDEIRLWVAGCATGEEAYSLAMLLAEQTAARPDAPAIQVFATDIDEAAIAAAREGFYTINDAADVSPERLSRFFTKQAPGFRVRRELREMVLFANHNVIKDPPFSRLDLIACRNMLIYLNHTAQERAMETFHFALNPGAFLFLGTSESVDGAGDLYAAVSKEHHIFQSRQAAARIAYPVPPSPPVLRFAEIKRRSAVGAAFDEKRDKHLLERPSFGDLHQRLLEQYAPPSIVVNENYDVVHLSETAGRFLQIAGGEPSKNLLKLIRAELRLELRAALYQAVQNRTNVEAPNLNVQSNGHFETINLQVRPIWRDEDAARGFLLVLFEPARETAETKNAAEKISTSSEQVSRRLEEELERVKTRLRVSVEQFETQTEELRASNEELQAMNEELRSSTEELETSREELQSVNEELVTVNQELKIKIEELFLSNNDFQNLMNSTDIGTIFLDRALGVKMFTPAVREIFNLIEADLNRPLADITSKLEFKDLHADVVRVLETLQTIEREVETNQGKWYLMRILPYRTAEDRINGVVVTFVDITRRKQSEAALTEAARRLERQARVFDTTLSAISDFAYTFDRDGRFIYANKALLDLLEITLEEITGKNFFELPYPKDLAERLDGQIRRVFETKKIIVDETPFTNPNGVSGYYEYIFTPVGGADGTVEVVAGSTRNTTERRRAEEALRESELQMRLVVEAAEMGTWEWDLRSGAILWNDQHFRLFGLEPENRALSYKDFEQCIFADDRQPVRERLEQSVEQEKVFQTEFRVVLPDGLTRWMSGYGRAVERDAEGRAMRMTGVMFDATERKEAGEDLRKSEERFRLLVESASDYAIFTVTLDNQISSWNAGAEKVFGWTESEALGQSGEIIFTPEDRKAGAPEKEIETALKEGRAPDERFHLRKDGSCFYVSGVMTLLKDADGSLQGFVKIARDMSERVEAEKAVGEKELLRKLVAAQEDERKRIARDLHDELGQQLTALRLKLENVRKLCEDEELCGKIDETQLIARRIDADVDFLAWELRPAALDDLGLLAALSNYVREWSRHSGVTAECHSTGLKRLRLAPEVETNLYRITQEALNNVHKHAAAKCVNVLLEKRSSSIVLIIEDDGKGFTVEDKVNRSKGLGLIGMKERAALIGGTLEIESAPRKGTTIYTRVPNSITNKERQNGR